MWFHFNGFDRTEFLPQFWQWRRMVIGIKLDQAFGSEAARNQGIWQNCKTLTTMFQMGMQLKASNGADLDWAHSFAFERELKFHFVYEIWLQKREIHESVPFCPSSSSSWVWWYLSTRQKSNNGQWTTHTWQLPEGKMKNRKNVRSSTKKT